MAALTTARPVSQILSDRSSSPSTSRKRPRSHYRPFSTLCTDSPYIDIEHKPAASLLKRASSVGGLQAFQTMTLGINFKGKREKDSPTAPQVSQLGTRKVSHPLKLNPRPPALQDGTKRPATSSGSGSRPESPAPPRLKVKRSMASIFTASEATASPETVVRPVLVHPQQPEDPPRPSTGKSVKFSFKEPEHVESEEDYPPQTFVPMNIWAKRHGMKLHPYGSEACYMQAYDPILLENDRYSDLLLQRLSSGSPSFYEYGKTPPVSALDLGCGQGHWVLHAASIWKNCEITGFDLVDITLPALKTTENVHFVQGNFLKYQLPFPDESFEFVRMANLALCVPYWRWVDVFTEVRRVLTRNGRLELVDDQILFPYGPAPVPKEDRKASPNMNHHTSFDIDDYYSDDFDSDTLEGEDSEESTLNSDNSQPSSSYKEKHFDIPISQLSASETVRPLHYRSPSPDPYEKPVITDPYLAQSSDATWRQRSTACRELESLFLSMLKDPEEGHHVFPHIVDFMGEFLRRAFGQTNSRKTATFNVKLAEWDSPIGTGMEVPDELTLEKEKEPSSYSTTGDPKKKLWTIREKKDKTEKKEKKKHKGGNGNTLAAPGSESERSSLESPVPPSLNPKAAKRLGIPVPPDMVSTTTTSKMATLKPNKKDKTHSPPLPPSGSPPAPTPNQKVGTPSAKAAGVFGMSYTELVAATAQATAGRRGGRKPQGLVQSPGLLIGSSTYIPLDPLELEMHACKYVHTLLGCRPALGQFVAKFVDEKGERLVDDEMFGYYMAEYEAFRRLRFGWPSDAAEPYEEDLFNEPSTHSLLPSSLNGRHQPDEAIQIRTIRVFQSVKSADTPLFSPPRSPTLWS